MEDHKMNPKTKKIIAAVIAVILIIDMVLPMALSFIFY